MINDDMKIIRPGRITEKALSPASAACAEALFAHCSDEGFAAVTIKETAEAAGVSLTAAKTAFARLADCRLAEKAGRGKWRVNLRLPVFEDGCAARPAGMVFLPENIRAENASACDILYRLSDKCGHVRLAGLEPREAMFHAAKLAQRCGICIIREGSAVMDFSQRENMRRLAQRLKKTGKV